MASEVPPLSPEDQAVLERLAARIVDLHLEVPAILAIESGRPLSVLAGQAMVFFEPIARALFRLSDFERFARIIERREHLEGFVRTIERRAELARAPRP
jgi:hypothetical protein